MADIANEWLGSMRLGGPAAPQAGGAKKKKRASGAKKATSGRKASAWELTSKEVVIGDKRRAVYRNKNTGTLATRRMVKDGRKVVARYVPCR
jgi:hypothetical protein